MQDLREEAYLADEIRRAGTDYDWRRWLVGLLRRFRMWHDTSKVAA